MPERLLWWQEAAIYHIYPRSFQDSNGDGVGDIEGIIGRLDYLRDIGFGAFWVSPFFPSPNYDFGYDVSDYCDIDPQFGTLESFDRMVAEAHRRGLRVLIDLVANHSSHEHPWFVESSSSVRSPLRDWYVWRDPTPDGEPPTNWRSYFGGPAWTLHTATGQYYLHHFLPQQPDLNYHHPAVVEAMLEVMRFWLRRGVDGFRLDAFVLLVHDADFRDETPNPRWKSGMREREKLLHDRTRDLPETRAVARRMRQVVDEFPGDRVLIGETYLPFPQLARYYGTPREPALHLPFNFSLLQFGVPKWKAENVCRIVSEYEASLPPGGWPNWVLGNHDKSRIATTLGEAQSRVAAMLLFTLRGTPTWYYGDELAMPDGCIPPDRLQDPAGLREPDIPAAGRDPCRTPMQWDATDHAGFSTGDPWLPVQDDCGSRNVATQLQDSGSMLHLVKKLIALRRHPALLHGTWTRLKSSTGVLAYRREADGDAFAVALNFTSKTRPRPVEAAGDVVLSTHPDGGMVDRLRPDEGIVVRVRIRS